MAKTVARPARIVIKTIRKAPGGVLGLTELATTQDKTRAAVGIVGGKLGGMAGGALGAATGPAAPVAVPVGAAVGHVAGQHIAEEVYDDHIDEFHRAKDEVRRGMAATKAWIKARNDQLARQGQNEFPTWAWLPQARLGF